MTAVCQCAGQGSADGADYVAGGAGLRPRIEIARERAAKVAGRRLPVCSGRPRAGLAQAAGKWFIPARTRRLQKSVEQGQNGDADDQKRAELDGQFMFHFPDVAAQVDCQRLDGGLLSGDGELQRLDAGRLFLDSSLDFFDSDLDFLNFSLQCLDIPLVSEVFITAGLSLGKDFGLGLGHADAGQAFHEVVGVEGGGFCFHGTEGNGSGGGLQVGVAAPRLILR